MGGLVRVTRVLCVGLCLAVGAWACGVQGTWTALAAVAKTGVTAALPLREIACGGPASCLALGPDGSEVAAAWDGAAWRTIPAPPVSAYVSPLILLDCAAPDWCAAFGGDRYSVWNGTAWSAPVAFSPPHPISDVSCPAVGVCYATDADDEPQSVKGAGWLFQVVGDVSAPMDDPHRHAGNRRIACSDADTCTSVGVYPGFAQRWDAGAWVSLIATGMRNAEFRDVSCPTDSLCVLVGHDGGTPRRPVVGTWTGGDILDVAILQGATVQDEGASLEHVDCAGPTSCLAQSTSMEGAVFDGSSWRVVLQPGAPATRSASPVACASSHQCFELLEGDAGPGSPLLWDWNGSSATRAHIGGTSETAPTTTYTDVSCSTASACVAVGTYRTGRYTRVVVARWDGTTWSLLPDVPLGADANVTVGPFVDCASTTSCGAVMFAPVNTIDHVPSVGSSWDGTTWSSLSIRTSAPEDVSCSGPSFCLAVTRPYGQFGERGVWTRNAWSAWVAVESPPAVREGLEGDETEPDSSARLSCASPTYCVLVTYSDDESRPGVAQAWRGPEAGWQTLPPAFPDAFGAATGQLRDIDCVAVDLCVAVGYGADPPVSGTRTDLALTWNGTSWSRQRVSSAAAPARLSALSCASVDACLAVAAAPEVDGPSNVVAGASGGRRGWRVAGSPAVVTPPWTLSVRAVSCAEQWCMVVGDKRNGPSTEPVAIRYRL